MKKSNSLQGTYEIVKEVGKRTAVSDLLGRILFLKIDKIAFDELRNKNFKIVTSVDGKIHNVRHAEKLPKRKVLVKDHATKTSAPSEQSAPSVENLIENDWMEIASPEQFENLTPDSSPIQVRSKFWSGTCRCLNLCQALLESLWVVALGPVQRPAG
jgi:hypothetical protein